ncbi:MAG: hypothetical protein OQK73_10430 [Gammaproteobacteria bacterium]|nr:hypothetical protein [Gammaproteobacteria bacterium]
MPDQQHKHPVTFRVIPVIAILFGLLTIKSGGMVLFTEGEAHQAAGDYVPFVLWFNFLAGFVYVVTGLGFWFGKNWATGLAIVIALTTLLVFVAFGIHILMGGSYEVRTVIAMSLRSFVWLSIALTAYILNKRQKHYLI